MQDKMFVYIRKLLLIIVMIIGAQVLGGCSNQQSNQILKDEHAIIDLTQFQFENDITHLDGEWEFYWNQLIDPEEIDKSLITGYIPIPRSWNNYITDERIISGDGYATFRVNFIIDKNERLGLKIPRLHTAYKLWINNELIASAGTVGKTRDTMTPQYLPQVAFFEASQGNNEIVIQVSNFHHRSGGMLESIKLGSEKQILGLRYKSIATNILLFGCLIFIGAYHLALFYFRRKNTSALYFGSFCILIGIRTILVGEIFFIYLFPEFSWEIAHKIMTLTYYLGIPLILMFFMSVFPKYFHNQIIKMAQIVGGVFMILIIFTPARIFTLVNPLYQVWSVIVIIYLFSTLAKVAFQKEKGGLVIVLGASVFLLTTLNDIVFLNIWLSDEGPSFLKLLFKTGNLSSAGLLIFAFANSLVIAKTNSESLEKEEILNEKLTEVNENLDKIVSHRTEALVESNKKVELQKCELEKANSQLQELSLKDQLTKLWNRRKYDETITLEWNRCLRHQRPIALIVLDVDYFKDYNDHYGHLAGDDCLVKIGQAIKNSLSRSTDMPVRYGGEEFIVILTESEKEDAMKTADMLRQKIEQLHIPHAQSCVSSYVTVSIGVACIIPDIQTSSEEFLKVADKALYEAKANGRNQVKFLHE